MAGPAQWEYRAIEIGTAKGLAEALNQLEAELPGEWQIVAVDLTVADGHQVAALVKRAVNRGEFREEKLQGF
jgi:hypothetical protein